MKVVLQRVTRAEVQIDENTVGKIDRGLLLLTGISGEDTERTVERMADKICKLRIFQDEAGKTNLSLSDVEGDLLIVSQFTLLADCRKGNRPSFIKAGSPQEAERLYEHFVKCCRARAPKVETGQFGADMKVNLTNDGPFTLTLDDKELFISEPR